MIAADPRVDAGVLREGQQRLVQRRSDRERCVPGTENPWAARLTDLLLNGVVSRFRPALVKMFKAGGKLLMLIAL